MEGVGSLTDQLAFAALETLVPVEALIAEVADAVLPAGGARATQKEQGRGGRREEAVVPPPPPSLVAGHDESPEPEDDAVVDEAELVGRMEQSKVDLEQMEHIEQRWEAPVDHGVDELTWLGLRRVEA